MTVSTQTSRADYTGNGATTAFTVPFYFLDNSHVQIIRTQISTGVATTLALTTDYTLSGAGVNAGGTATMVTAPTADQRLTILRSVPFTQLQQYVPNDPFPAASHERALDLLTMEVQQLYENISRSLTLSANSSGVSAALPSPQAGTLVGWNGTATALQNYNAGSLGVAISYAAWQASNFSGDGVTTSFVIPTDAGVAANCAVSVGGVTQAAGINYTYTSSTRTITFLTGAPPVGVNNVNIRYGQALAQGTVASTNITDATATGLSVLTAASAAAARTAITAAASGANNDITSLTALASVPTVVTTAINAKKMAQSVTSASAAVATGTTIVPRDDTIPQQTEGDQYLSVTITPQNASSTLEIEVLAYLSAANSSISLTGALFQDSTANALTAENQVVPLATQINVVALRHVMTAGTTSATTFKFRAGGDSATTLTLNGASGARLLGGVLNSRIIVKEYLP